MLSRLKLHLQLTRDDLWWVYLQVERLATACPLTFDEATLFVGEDSEEMRSQLDERFDRLQSVMSCVGCDRCKQSNP